jgi:hypothetical protein
MLFSQAILFSQNNNTSLNLKGKHAFSMSMGFSSNSSTVLIDNWSGDRGNSSSDHYGNTFIDAKTGFIGSFSYIHWFENEWALNFQVGMINAIADINFNDVSTNSVFPILFGFKFYPSALALGSVGRVYGGVNFGAYVGVSTKSTLWVFHSTSIETVLGFEPNFGIDLFVTDWLRIGPSISYDIFGDFHDLGFKNDNTFGFSVNFGLVL